MCEKELCVGWGKNTIQLYTHTEPTAVCIHAHGATVGPRYTRSLGMPTRHTSLDCNSRGAHDKITVSCTYERTGFTSSPRVRLRRRKIRGAGPYVVARKEEVVEQTLEAGRRQPHLEQRVSPLSLPCSRPRQSH